MNINLCSVVYSVIDSIPYENSVLHGCNIIIKEFNVAYSIIPPFHYCIFWASQLPRSSYWSQLTDYHQLLMVNQVVIKCLRVLIRPPIINSLFPVTLPHGKI